jgi:hypothetical protein
MANVFGLIQKSYSDTSKSFNQISLIFIIIGFGALIIFYINNGGNKATDNTINNFKCSLTAVGQETILDTTDLKTNTQLSTINYDTEVYKGSATKNSIAALTAPKFVAIDVVSPCVDDDAEVVIVRNKNEVRVYPRMLLNYHIAINDQFGDLSLLISYSPLSGHYQVYDRKVKNEPLVFGISGYLYRNSDLFFDTRTETLWSQYNGKALVGSMVGASLNRYPFELMTYKEARTTYPTAVIANFETGHRHDYSLDPFADYLTNSEIVAPVLYISSEFPIKSRVVGFNYNNKAYAMLSANTLGSDNTVINLGTDNLLFIRSKGETKLLNNKKQSVNFDYSFWFAWKDFNPETKTINFN